MSKEKEITYCFECEYWKPYKGNLYGRCIDIKKKTMRLDFCKEGKKKK